MYNILVKSTHQLIPNCQSRYPSYAINGYDIEVSCLFREGRTSIVYVLRQ